MGLRHRVFAAAFDAMHVTRLPVLARPWTRGLGVILTLHHVRPFAPRAFAPNRLLEITPDYLDTALRTVAAAGYDIVSLAEAVERLRHPVKGKRPFAVITFDDGYRDNAEYAAPILRRHGAPWTLFVTSDFADGTGRLWWLELEEAIRRLPAIEIDLPGEGPLRLPSGTAQEKDAAFARIYWHIRRGPMDQILSVTGALADGAGIVPADLCRSLCMSWDELRALAAAEPLLSIGAHTVSHPMLAKLADAPAREEVAAGRDRIARELGQLPLHLAYPVGDPASAGGREIAAAAALGFSCAVTTRPGHLFAAHGEHLHALPRISLNGYFQTATALSAMLDGLPFLLWNRGRRLNLD